jgi:hypothetical protein
LGQEEKFLRNHGEKSILYEVLFAGVQSVECNLERLDRLQADVVAMTRGSHGRGDSKR